MSKRQELRDRRSQERRRRILSLALVVAGLAALTAGLLILPNLSSLGDLVAIEPRERPFVDGAAIGRADAPVLVEVFEDFQCPACRQFTEQSERLLEQELVANGTVRLVFRQYPFIGPESELAAHASLCAADQGRFWDFHDILFANQIGENVGAFTKRRLTAFAESLGLQMSTFESCLNNQLHQAAIDSDRALGLAYRISGTPSIIINGAQHFQGFVPSYEQLKAAIEQELEG